MTFRTEQLLNELRTEEAETYAYYQRRKGCANETISTWESKVK